MVILTPEEREAIRSQAVEEYPFEACGVILARAIDGTLNTHFSAFPSPMGVAIHGSTLTLGAQNYVWHFRNQPPAGGEGSDAARSVAAGAAVHQGRSFSVHLRRRIDRQERQPIHRISQQTRRHRDGHRGQANRQVWRTGVGRQPNSIQSCWAGTAGDAAASKYDKPSDESSAS